MSDTVEVTCPHCGQPGTVQVEEEADFVQDCAVCCRPWQVRVRIRRDGTADVSVSAEA